MSIVDILSQTISDLLKQKDRIDDEIAGKKAERQSILDTVKNLKEQISEHRITGEKKTADSPRRSKRVYIRKVSDEEILEFAKSANVIGVRDVQERFNISNAAAHARLNDLVEKNALIRERVGRGHLYRVGQAESSTKTAPKPSKKKAKKKQSRRGDTVSDNDIRLWMNSRQNSPFTRQELAGAFKRSVAWATIKVKQLETIGSVTNIFTPTDKERLEGKSKVYAYIDPAVQHARAKDEYEPDEASMTGSSSRKPSNSSSVAGTGRSLISNDPDIRRLCKIAVEQQYKVEKSGKHIRVTTPGDNGQKSFVMISATPSDVNGARQAQRDLEKIGVKFDN